MRAQSTDPTAAVSEWSGRLAAADTGPTPASQPPTRQHSTPPPPGPSSSRSGGPGPISARTACLWSKSQSLQSQSLQNTENSDPAPRESLSAKYWRWFEDQSAPEKTRDPRRSDGRPANEGPSFKSRDQRQAEYYNLSRRVVLLSLANKNNDKDRYQH